jgi:hypothetical protein
MDSPLDVQQIVAAFVFWAAAFSGGLWTLHGAGLCGSPPPGTSRGHGCDCR